ncbi:hypothetical protein [Phycisphaera mikurensis]|uniref:Uncharacterized protein n=1 Tax=Phycisphaera mikurensis (strain NBRC 102666 / KCTC 22515 / FYK2301M01) TaxID=1142394 RepID=I0IJ22_PHYMF|nr:hypothetical protein [Phycisphaera mikurensis]MBB6443107.1 hypothetical protein [Phycisphaera mikurensis]BAM05260.1 hypothetical protein PSMK_31010 [Phycisphaera mikurensis NBRC 102666]
MMTAVLAILCVYLAACYAYGGYLLVGVLRGSAAGEAPAAHDDAVADGPRAAILRAAREGEAREAPPARMAA